MRKSVYNLEFRPWCRVMTVFGYRFHRVKDYEEKLKSLHHLISGQSEFAVSACDGQHAVTANVDIPDHEEMAVLDWSGENHTALDDVLLLISLFTGRDVFCFDRRDEREVIIADQRQYQWGGGLACSIPYKASHDASKEDMMNSRFAFDIGCEEGLNDTYRRIRTEQWRSTYGRGRFLFLAQNAFRRQPLESAFIQSWTIWEHLFALLNQSWLSGRHLRRLDSAEKIAFILTEYALCRQVDGASRERIVSLAEIRNTLVHDGRFPQRGAVHDDAVLFIRVTEFVIAKIFGLVPSNVFDTVGRLEQFLATRPASRGGGDCRGGQGA